MLLVCILDLSPQPAAKDLLAPEKDDLTAHLPVLWLLGSQIRDLGGFTMVARPKRK